MLILAYVSVVTSRAYTSTPLPKENELLIIIIIIIIYGDQSNREMRQKLQTYWTSVRQQSYICSIL